VFSLLFDKPELDLDWLDIEKRRLNRKQKKRPTNLRNRLLSL
jgi:hypothetical protein